jgi:signal transduction histidine kinase
MFNRELEEQVKAKTESLRESYETMRQMALRLEDIREEERAAIAREIHDDLGQQLTGLKMDIAWVFKRLYTADDESSAKRIGDALKLLDGCVRSVRRISTELRPSILDDLGLIAAIEWQSHEFQKRSGIHTLFRTDMEKIDLPPKTAIGLFRICQESLTNVADQIHPGAGNDHLDHRRRWERLRCRGDRQK